MVLGAFAVWESTTASPMLDTSFFRNPRFTAASVGIMLLFFAMFGSIFLQTQYLQFVMGYTRAGGRRPPPADGGHDAHRRPQQRPKLAERIGTKLVVGTGLSLATLAMLLMAGLPDHDISYWGDVAWRLVVFALGMGLTMGPATESIMGSLPRAKAGVGSAMNDTTRQVGGALGVAIVGSVMSSAYGHRIDERVRRTRVPRRRPWRSPRDGLGQALEVIRQAPDRHRRHRSGSPRRRRRRSCSASTAACSWARRRPSSARSSRSWRCRPRPARTRATASGG